MSDGYQLDLPTDPDYQTQLIDLLGKFETVAGENLQLNQIFHMCLLALQDITPELIEKKLMPFDLSPAKRSRSCVQDVFLQRTTNISPDDRQLLTQIKLHLLANKNKDFSRRRIALAIFILANGLAIDKIQYILSEYRLK